MLQDAATDAAVLLYMARALGAVADAEHAGTSGADASAVTVASFTSKMLSRYQIGMPRREEQQRQGCSDLQVDLNY